MESGRRGRGGCCSFIFCSHLRVSKRPLDELSRGIRTGLHVQRYQILLGFGSAFLFLGRKENDNHDTLAEVTVVCLFILFG